MRAKSHYRVGHNVINTPFPHGCWLSNPTLVGISKVTLDKSLGFAQFKQDFKNKVYTKRSNMHKIIIPEQIVENPNFKLILVVKE